MKITLLVVGKTNDPFHCRHRRICQTYPALPASASEVSPELREYQKPFGRTQKGERSGFAVESVPTGRPSSCWTNTDKEHRSVEVRHGWKADGGRPEADGVRRGRPHGFFHHASCKSKRKGIAFAHDFRIKMIRSDFHPTNLSAMTIINGEPYHHELTLPGQTFIRETATETNVTGKWSLYPPLYNGPLVGAERTNAAIRLFPFAHKKERPLWRDIRRTAKRRSTINTGLTKIWSIVSHIYPGSGRSLSPHSAWKRQVLAHGKME